ncbi:MAG TPA: polyphosphate kinase 1, partial [Mesotoga sp.]|nr:polyphosphate kinase 1 [Mesotoga sp.]
MNLDDPNLYLNRELSWLDFNERVLEEAFDKENPVLERLKFLSITSSNLDEFFMIRVAGLKEQEEAGYAGRDPSGMTATEQLKAISIKVHELVERQNNCLHRSLLPALKKENIFFLKLDEFDGEQKEYIERYFIDTVYPVVTPMAIDQSRPFPFLQNRSINLGVVLEQEEQPLFAVVQIPPVLPRLIKLPSKRGECFTFMGDILKSHMNRLFSGYHIRDIHAFRITRNADLSIEEEDAHDLLIEIEKSLQRRRWGFPVRLEIERGMNVELREYLKEMLELADEDIYVSGPPLDLTLWMKFLQLKAFDNLRYPKALPQASPDLYGQDDLFKIIRDEDTMLHHPFESFQHISDLVYKAAEDPRVLAIKQTLYRVSGNSPIIDALVHAADNGKQVTVLVEIKARFDEESNIQWAKTLERAGCHVVYGLVGLKTHVKMLLVVREEDDGIRRYLHLSTGNYNDTTARLYTDIGLLTVRDQLTTDAS